MSNSSATARRDALPSTAAIIRVARKETSSKLWAIRLLERKPARVVSVVLANETVRIVWATLTREQDYVTLVTAA